MEIRLVVISTKAKGQALQLKLPAVIGRGREATTQLSHPLISRKHCEVYESKGFAVVRDMGSLNGTFINEQPITEAVLSPGETLTLGSVTFRAEYEPGTVPPPAPPPAKKSQPSPRKSAAGTTPHTPVKETVAKLPGPAVQEYEEFELVEFEDDEPKS